MSNQKLLIALRSALFLAVLAIVAWVSGEPFIFPSLGPTAYVLAFRLESQYEAKTIIGGHFFGVVGGLVSYYLVVSPHQLNMITEPFTNPALMLSLGAVLALFLTVLLMLIFEASHPPACATTLIVSLGILSSWKEALVIMIAVVIIYLSYLLFCKISQKLDLISSA